MTNTSSALAAENDALRIRDACNGATDFKRLRIAREKGWKDSEILEYARICFHRPGKDYATPASIRNALDAIMGKKTFALMWRTGFRKRGSVIAPPRSGPVVEHSVGTSGLTPFHRYWPYHSCHVVAKVNAMVRERFNLPPDMPVPLNYWNMCHYEYFDNQRRQMWYVQKQKKKAEHAKAKTEKEARVAERTKAKAAKEALLTPEQREQAAQRKAEQAEKRRKTRIERENLEFEKTHEACQRHFQRILGPRPAAYEAVAQ